VLVYIRSDIWNILRAFIRENAVLRFQKPFTTQSLDTRLGWFVIIGTIPIVVIGLLFKHIIEGAFTKSLTVIGTNLIVFALLLGAAELFARARKKKHKEIEAVTWQDTLVIGLAQCFALIPGASRSGTTLTGGLFMGLERSTAARYSFLVSIPAVFASGLLELKQSLPELDHSGVTTLILGTIAAFVSGYLAIDLLIRFLKKNSTLVFIIYRLTLGATILAFFAK
jgi:undecaprenyl-diphosphatase